MQYQKIIWDIRPDYPTPYMFVYVTLKQQRKNLSELNEPSKDDENKKKTFQQYVQRKKKKADRINILKTLDLTTFFSILIN